MSHIRVLQPGFQTTVQDLGRFGFAHLGVSPCGAADTLSLRAGNRLAGNPDSAAALEMTLTGGTYTFEQAAVFALTGAEFEAALDAKPVPFWRAVRACPGAHLQVGPARSGARCYLCVAGGIDVEPALGSRSTDLRAHFGGFGGRVLRQGDRIAIANCASAGPGDANASHLARFLRGPVLRVIAARGAELLCANEYTVREDSNRLGIRLSGPALPGAGDELLTEGVPPGAVQIPPGGQPIILFVDQQTTGGYATPAHVISADLPKVGQLRPRDRVRFEPVDLAEAIRALRLQESELP